MACFHYTPAQALLKIAINEHVVGGVGGGGGATSRAASPHTRNKWPLKSISRLDKRPEIQPATNAGMDAGRRWQATLVATAISVAGGVVVVVVGYNMRIDHKIRMIFRYCLCVRGMYRTCCVCVCFAVAPTVLGCWALFCLRHSIIIKIAKRMKWGNFRFLKYKQNIRVIVNVICNAALCSTRYVYYCASVWAMNLSAVATDIAAWRFVVLTVVSVLFW